ncbi:MAG: hypothetical protein HC814_03015 [Rhodobacteraceae bacterium]|nr:hypothetical protein [Paracoccaceae bacterium]
MPDLKPTTLSLGSGKDTLLLKVAQDYYAGSAQYVVKVNGSQIGGPLTASALQASGQHDSVTIKGDWGGKVAVTVQFLNDAYGGAVDKDRNLHVQSLTLNGTETEVNWRFGGSGTLGVTLDKAAPAGMALPAPAYAAMPIGTTISNVLNGSSGADLIRGAGGNDTMTGGGGKDTFIFGPADGHDWITDFTAGMDRLLFTGIDPESVRGVLTTFNAVDGVRLTYGEAGDSVFLQNVTKLVAGDLVFD